MTIGNKREIMAGYPAAKLKGMSNSEYADLHGIHRNTLSKWVRQYGYTNRYWLRKLQIGGKINE